MSRIPEHIQNEIILQALLLKRHEMGWYIINQKIKNYTLHLKKTPYKFPYDFVYHKIKRVTRIFFTKKLYTWLKQAEYGLSKYYYISFQFYNYLQYRSMIENNYIIGDYDISYDY